MGVLEFTLNGAGTRVAGVPPTTTLLQYLRSLGLTGTKEGCAEGDCGACSVAILDPDAPGGPAWRAVNACLVLLPMVHGRTVVTVEGLPEGGQPHPAAAELVERLGSQCGYCTPGVVMSLFEACYRRDLDRPERLDDQLAGNLCRCTGYRPIREAALAIAGRCPKDRFAAALQQRPTPRTSLELEAEGRRFFLPTSLAEVWAIHRRYPEVRFVAGGTDLSLEITKRFAEPPLLCGLEAIAELRPLSRRDGAIHLGAGALLSDVEAFVEEALPPLARMLRFFAARQIKNRGTIGGNLVTASPIGDLAPVFLALGAELVLVSEAGTRNLPIDAFFLDYRRTALLPGELLLEVVVPELGPSARAAAYKVSKRQELDISTVSAAFWVQLDDSARVEQVRLAYGGMAATPKRAVHAEAALLHQPFTEAQVARASAELERDFQPLSDHRGSAWYRGIVARNLLRGFWLETQQERLPRLPVRPIGTITPSEVEE